MAYNTVKNLDAKFVRVGGSFSQKNATNATTYFARYVLKNGNKKGTKNVLNVILNHLR